VLRGLETRVAVTPETRNRILQAARKVGYRPNPIARGLRGARTGLLGVIVRDGGDPLFNAALDLLVSECRRVGWHVVVAHAQSSSERALDLVEVLETRYCEAVVIAGDLPDDTRLWKQLEDAAKVPVLGIFQGQRRLSVPTINIDNRRGADLAMRHLYELGHRRIAFIGHSWGCGHMERGVAYDEFMAGYALPSPPAYRQLPPHSPEAGREAGALLLSLPEPPTAIFAATDRLAIAAMSAAYEANLRIPRDLSVVGFDDIPAAATSSPPLTTVRQPLQQIVCLAIEDLVRRTREPDAPVTPRICLDPALTIRASTAPAPIGPGPAGVASG
jgi:DNA-binding LacI/PurR family transcriptional regulator